MKTPETPPTEAPSTRSLIIQVVVTTAVIVAGVALLAILARGPAEIAADWVVEHLGIWGISVAVILADALTFPVPPDTYLLAAVASHADQMTLLAAISVSSVVAGNLAYVLGPLLQHVPLLGKKIENFRGTGELLYKKWGLWTVVVAALTPIPFSIICWFAGIYKMPYRPFLIGTLARIPRFVIYYYLFELGWAGP